MYSRVIFSGEKSYSAGKQRYSRSADPEFLCVPGSKCNAASNRRNGGTSRNDGQWFYSSERIAANRSMAEFPTDSDVRYSPRSRPCVGASFFHRMRASSASASSGNGARTLSSQGSTSITLLFMTPKFSLHDALVIESIVEIRCWARPVASMTGGRRPCVGVCAGLSRAFSSGAAARSLAQGDCDLGCASDFERERQPAVPLTVSVPET